MVKNARNKYKMFKDNLLKWFDKDYTGHYDFILDVRVVFPLRRKPALIKENPDRL